MVEVSIIIPFYNRITLLTKAISSVRNQSFKDYEIIIIDDGSEENIKDHISIDEPNMVYIRNKNNLGAAKSRNIGIKAANGNYIAFLDSDDEFSPDKLQTQIKAMKERPDIAWSHTSYNQIDDNSRILRTVHSGYFTGKVYPKICIGCPIATPTVIVDKRKIEELSFWEEARFGEDVILWIQLAKKHPVMGIDVPLTNVRVSSHSSINEPNKMLEGEMCIIDYLARNEEELSKIIIKKQLSNLYKHVGTAYFRLGDSTQSVKYLFKSLNQWPLQLSSYAYLLFNILPKGLQGKLSDSPILRKI